jgi:hypothetical protein
MKKNKYFTEVYGITGDEIIQHVPGTLSGDRWLQHQVDATVRGQVDRPDTSVIGPSAGFPMNVIQKSIYERMVSKQDSFAGVPPAAGKTKPMQTAWSELFVNALRKGIPLNSPEFPRILYVAKTKQLAMEGILQNFQMWIYELFAKNPGITAQDQRHILSILGLSGINSFSELNVHSQNQIHQLIQSLTAVRLGGISPQVIKSDIFFFKPIIVTTPIITPADKFQLGGMNYKAVADLVTNYSKYFSMIVIDEFQQYLPMPGKDLTYGTFTKDTEKNFDMIFKIIKNAAKPGKCGVHLLTGTVNKTTAEKFCHLMNTETGRNFKTIIGSGNVLNPETGKEEFIGNRSNLTVVPLERMSTPDDRIKLCKSIVQNKQSRSIMVIFSTRRTATTGIFNLLNQLIRVLPARDPSILLDSPMKDNPTLAEMHKKLEGDFINPEFNKNMYPEGMLSNDDKVHVNDIEYLKLFDVDAAEQQGDDSGVSTKLLHSPNESNLLYQGALRGIGVMIGKMDDRMKGVIQKLFRKEKIYLLLATDSLGIGANVLCRHLYLPNLEKPDGGNFGTIDDSSLIQLINRAGRDLKLIPNAFVYCTNKDYPVIDRAVRSSPEKFVSEIPFDQIAERVKNKNSLLRSLYNQLF